MPKKLTEE
jgi:hypothetical protein